MNDFIIGYSIILLVYRNIVATIDKMFLIWQISFSSCLYICCRNAYSALIGDQGITIGSLTITYVSFLTAGMIDLM